MAVTSPVLTNAFTLTQFFFSNTELSNVHPNPKNPLLVITAINVIIIIIIVVAAAVVTTVLLFLSILLSEMIYTQ